jgi:hypothetical protein
MILVRVAGRLDLHTLVVLLSVIYSQAAYMSEEKYAYEGTPCRSVQAPGTPLYQMMDCRARNLQTLPVHIYSNDIVEMDLSLNNIKVQTIILRRLRP